MARRRVAVAMRLPTHISIDSARRAKKEAQKRGNGGVAGF
jgi:hypothetical protein